MLTAEMQHVPACAFDHTCRPIDDRLRAKTLPSVIKRCISISFHRARMFAVKQAL